MKCKITQDYYGNFFSEYGTELDIPEEQINRWRKAEEDYRAFQNESDEEFKKLKELK